MKDERTGVNSLLLATIALITVVVAPIATLILIQLKFLPDAITWWHRAIVLVDVGIVLVMWHRFFYDSGVENQLLFFNGQPQLRILRAWSGRLSIVAAAFWLCFWEGRWAGEPWIGRADLDATANGIVLGLFPDRLILPYEIVVGESRLEEIRSEVGGELRNGFVPTRDFGKRDLQGAILYGADLRGVGLREANLNRVELDFARLEGANLYEARLRGANLVGAELEGAYLQNADLHQANLVLSRLHGAHLDGAKLGLANLSRAKLQAATLENAEAQEADLSQADLRGSSLRKVSFQRANLSGGDLSGADLTQALLQQADLASSSLQGSNLNLAQLEGANLGRAELRGADLDLAEVESTILRRTDETLPSGLNAVAAGNLWVPDPDGEKHRSRLAETLEEIACSSDGAPYVARALVRSQRDRLRWLGDRFVGMRKRMKAGQESRQVCPGVDGFSKVDWDELDSIHPIEARTGSLQSPP
jgi:uncharacterized protein YjbI with pentapeptide repeats